MNNFLAVYTSQIIKLKEIIDKKCFLNLISRNDDRNSGLSLVRLSQGDICHYVADEQWDMVSKPIIWYMQEGSHFPLNVSRLLYFDHQIQFLNNRKDLVWGKEEYGTKQNGFDAYSGHKEDLILFLYICLRHSCTCGSIMSGHRRAVDIITPLSMEL